MNVERVAGAGALALVVAGLAVGFTAIGPPQHRRLAELDQRRLNDLAAIARRIHGGEAGGRRRTVTPPARASADWPRDPETVQPYAYQRETSSRYRLCTTFALPSEGDGDARDGAAPWRHAAGRTCYRFDATSSAATPERAFGPARSR